MDSRRSLSFETFVAALAVVGASACSKAAPAQAEPVQTVPPLATSAVAEPAPSAPAVAVANDKDDAIAAVDAGIEMKKPSLRAAPNAAPPPKAQRNVQAGCGAGACSDDMKKK